MSRLWWAVVVVCGFVWAALHYSAGYLDNRAIRARQSNCENGLFFQGEQSISAARIRCSAKIYDSISFHRMMLILGTPAYFIAFAALHFGMARSRQRHQDIKSEIRNRTPLEVVLGSRYGDITNSVFINESTLKDVEIKNENRNPDLIGVLGQIAIIVHDAQNSAASVELNKINRELAKDNPDKTMLQTTWAGLKELLPVFKSGLEATVAFEKMIGS